MKIKMGKLFLLALLCMLTVFPLEQFDACVAASNNPLDTVSEAWNETGAQLDSVYLEISGVTKTTGGKILLKKLKLKKIHTWTKTEKGVYYNFYAEGTSHGDKVQVLLQTVSLNNNKTKTFATINVTTKKIKKANDFYHKLQNLAIKNLSQRNEAIVLNGTIKGPLMESKMGKLATKASSKIRGKLYQPVQDLSFWTQTGYTPLLSRSINIDPDKVNLQWAFHFDKDKGITQVFLGYPLIMSDY